MGKVGTAPVVLFGRGRPGSLTAKLRVMPFEDDKVAGIVAQARFKPMNSGFLLLENAETLVMECNHPQDPTGMKEALRRYFVVYFHLLVPPDRYRHPGAFRKRQG